jgi:hypothetical protein
VRARISERQFGTGGEPDQWETIAGSLPEVEQSRADALRQFWHSSLASGDTGAEVSSSAPSQSPRSTATALGAGGWHGNKIGGLSRELARASRASRANLFQRPKERRFSFRLRAETVPVNQKKRTTSAELNSPQRQTANVEC